MKLKDKDFRDVYLDLPPSYRECWDLGEGFDVMLSLGPEACTFWVSGIKNCDLTYKVAELMGLDTSHEQLISHGNVGSELYATMALTCVGVVCIINQKTIWIYFTE